MHYLYVLKSLKDNELYIGTTDNIERRILQHNKGQSKSTKFRRPLILTYAEQYSSKSEAMKREWYFKNTTDGNKLMRKLIRS